MFLGRGYDKGSLYINKGEETRVIRRTPSNCSVKYVFSIIFYVQRDGVGRGVEPDTRRTSVPDTEIGKDIRLLV